MPIATTSTEATHLLADDRSFQDLLWPYLAPYLVYVAIASILAKGPGMGQAN